MSAGRDSNPQSLVGRARGLAERGERHGRRVFTLGPKPSAFTIRLPADETNWNGDGETWSRTTVRVRALGCHRRRGSARGSHSDMSAGPSGESLRREWVSAGWDSNPQSRVGRTRGLVKQGETHARRGNSLGVHPSAFTIWLPADEKISSIVPTHWLRRHENSYSVMSTIRTQVSTRQPGRPGRSPGAGGPENTKPPRVHTGGGFGFTSVRLGRTSVDRCPPRWIGLPPTRRTKPHDRAYKPEPEGSAGGRDSGW